MAVDSPQDVYARKLLSNRGYPLWTPEPNIELPECYRLEGLRIGDVGAVVPEDGSFDVFFNITLPRKHPLHADDGVPNNFTQVELKRNDYRVNPDAEPPGSVISSPTVDYTVSCTDPFYIDGRSRRLTDYEFALARDEKEGAILILPEGVERHRLAKTLLLLDVIIQNAVDWYRFAREKLYRDIRSDDLYLITGFHKARSWSLASFRGIHATPSQCKVVQLRQAGPILLDKSSWETPRPPDWRIGPRYSTGTGIPNQAVFITGFKIAVNEELLHWKRVTVKVGHSERTLASRVVGLGASWANLVSGLCSAVEYLSEPTTQDEGADETPSGYNTSDHEDSERVHVVSVPKITQPFHPSNVINRYMLKKEPSAMVAVTHDSQWIGLLERGVLESQDITQAGRLEAVVSREYHVVTKDGAVYLESVNTPRNMAAIADVGGSRMAAQSLLQVAQGQSMAASNEAPYSRSNRFGQMVGDQSRQVTETSSGVVNIEDTQPDYRHQISNSGISPPGIQFNNSFTDDDACDLVAYAMGLKQYHCGWITNGQLCNAPILGGDAESHLRTVHLVNVASRFECKWNNCGDLLSKGRLTRHVQEKHLEYRWPCPK